MKVNIIHQENSNLVMNDAEVAHYLLHRQKDKTEITHHNANNYTIPNASINIFIEVINYSFIDSAKFNIFIPNQHYFSRENLPLLDAFDLIICKTQYCYELFREHVPAEKLRRVYWRSIDRSNHLVEKDRNQWLIQFTDNNYQDIQKLINLWKLEYPTLNILCSGVPRTAFKRSTLPNIMYLEEMDQRKYEHLFNECMIHVCFDSVDNYNHAVNQCMLSGAIPICVDKGPVLETVCPDGYFPILSTKKKIKHYMGSKHTFSEENLNDTIQKILGTSDTTLEIMGKNNKKHAIRNQNMVNEKSAQFFKEVFRQVHSISKKKEVEITDESLPKVSLVTVFNDAEKFFKLASVNFRSLNYPRDKLEWVVVNNTEYDIEKSLPPVDMRDEFNIKYIPYEANLSKGALMNRGVSVATGEVIMRMDSNYFFYQDGLNKTLEAFVRSGKECMATTAVGAFHINRYISLIATNGFSMNYLDRVHLGTLCFRRSFWEERNFLEEDKPLTAFLKDRMRDYYEYNWKDKFVSLIYSENEEEWKIPQHQSPNGCHYKFSKKVYEFIVALDKEDAQGSDTKAAAEAAAGAATVPVAPTEIKEI